MARTAPPPRPLFALVHTHLHYTPTLIDLQGLSSLVVTTTQHHWCGNRGYLRADAPEAVQLLPNFYNLR